jgi:hypothetical protein
VISKGRDLQLGLRLGWQLLSRWMDSAPNRRRGCARDRGGSGLSETAEYFPLRMIPRTTASHASYGGAESLAKTEGLPHTDSGQGDADETLPQRGDGRVRQAAREQKSGAGGAESTNGAASAVAGAGGQEASSNVTTMRLPSTASAAWIFSDFVMCFGSSMRRQLFR